MWLSYSPTLLHYVCRCSHKSHMGIQYEWLDQNGPLDISIGSFWRPEYDCAREGSPTQNVQQSQISTFRPTRQKFSISLSKNWGSEIAASHIVTQWQSAPLCRDVFLLAVALGQAFGFGTDGSFLTVVLLFFLCHVSSNDKKNLIETEAARKIFQNVKSDSGRYCWTFETGEVSFRYVSSIQDGVDCFELHSFQEEEWLSTLTNSLQRSEQLKERMLSTLTSFEQRLSNLEATVLPLYEHTGMLQQRQQSKRSASVFIKFIIVCFFFFRYRKDNENPGLNARLLSSSCRSGRDGSRFRVSPLFHVYHLLQLNSALQPSRRLGEVSAAHEQAEGGDPVLPVG